MQIFGRASSKVAFFIIKCEFEIRIYYKGVIINKLKVCILYTNSSKYHPVLELKLVDCTKVQ